MPATHIAEIQGQGFFSPLAGQTVRVHGIVTGFSRRGFFIQDPEGAPAGTSSGLFVFGRNHKVRIGDAVLVEGKVANYRSAPHDRPMTQLLLDEVRQLGTARGTIRPVWLTAEVLPEENQALASFLNQHEGMLVGVEAGATFLAGSNPFGDYVLMPPDAESTRRATCGGHVIDPAHPKQWFPGFRIIAYQQAPKLNVGSVLKQPLVGPLNYRSSAYQIAAQGPIQVDRSQVTIPASPFRQAEDALTVMTLNGFNLDAQIEDPRRVQDPRRDVDDDIGDGRFRALAQAIVRQGRCPDIVALQEIQDNDGAEITSTVDASRTYLQLVAEIAQEGGPRYDYADAPPVADADGGQPGGNIRNGFLFDPARVTLACPIRRFATDAPAFQGSRKPVRADFVQHTTGRKLAVINLHLASKRHQHGIFSLDRPGFDPRLDVRVQQAQLVAAELDILEAQGRDYYVTGDFNDFEFSEPLKALTTKGRRNLVETLPELERFDYNHRGTLHALMHGVVSANQVNRSRYAILHGNELIGIQPGTLGAKASDHAYVLAQLALH